MKTTASFAFLAASLTLAICFATIFTSTAQANDVTFDWATIGDVDNEGDAQEVNGEPVLFGAVDYTYRISKTEVTNTQYTHFLNSVADTDPNSLYHTLMSSSSRGGIIRSGSSGSYTYTVKPDSPGNDPGGGAYTYGNKPVGNVTFFSAMRFINWLENGQPIGPQGTSTTEAGVYTIGNGTNEVRNPSATYFIPSEDEWYKAAYYDPNKPGGAGYYDYPTSTDEEPDNNLPSADTGNSANFGSTSGQDFLYPLTDVGAYTASASPYGTFDQGGNATEWNEAVFTDTANPFRFTRGGSAGTSESSVGDLGASVRAFTQPTAQGGTLGIRVASLPEQDGDFDNDNDVDGADFLVWQRDPNVGSLSVWEDTFGAPLSLASSLASTVAVPEPTTGTMLLGAMASVGLLMRRRVLSSRRIFK